MVKSLKTITCILCGLAFILLVRNFCENKWKETLANAAAKQTTAEPVIAELNPVMVKIEVRKGWCLSKIAQDLGTDWQEIARLNGLKNPDKIYAGQKLNVIPFNRNNIVKVSYYGNEFQGKPMADGKNTPFDMNDPTITAQKFLPIGTKVKLTSIQKKITLIAIVKDRGPYYEDRCFDLSYAGAKKLEILQIGVAQCKVEILH